MDIAVRTIRAVIDSNGNCTDCNCALCPIKGICVTTDTKQTTLEKARSWLIRNEKKGAK